VHDVNILDALTVEAGAFYLLDRGYLDFARLFRIQQERAFFITRTKSNFQFCRVYSAPVKKNLGIICDQTVELTGFYSAQHYPEKLRRIRYHDSETETQLTFLTNNFSLAATTIAKLFRNRWQIELFFKWVKQHLHIKAFYGTSPNAVKTQIWTAIATYVLVAVIKKRLNIEMSLYNILQILSITLFEKSPLLQVLSEENVDVDKELNCNQLNLFN
jgi:IS4 transposase